MLEQDMPPFMWVVLALFMLSGVVLFLALAYAVWADSRER
jgi:hypothetical protein